MHHDIILCVSNDISADQRIHKMALSYMDEKLNVLMLGRRRRKSTHTGFRVYDVKRMRLIFEKSMFFYAELNIRMFLFLMFKSYQIAVANDMDTLPAVWLAAKLKHKKVIFDSHELFSEVPELIGRPIVKGFWKKLENILIPRIDAGITVSSSIAEYYLDLYDKKFLVMPNYPLGGSKPPKKNRQTFGLPERRKILLYQGALNKNRGLELMIETMPLLPGWILVIAGTGNLEHKLKKMAEKAKLEQQVFFTGQLMFHQLQMLTPMANIGLSLEEDSGLNYQFALPNKVFDYIQAQIPVIVSDLPEMARLIADFHVGEILKTRTVVALAALVKKIEIANEKLFYRYYLQEATRHFIWSNNQKKLHNIIEPLILQSN